MTEPYTFDRKKKLLDRIKKSASRSDYEQIQKIIIDGNSDLGSMKNANGVFMRFNSLTNDTYDNIANYLDKIDKRKIKQLKDEVMEESEAADVADMEESSANNNNTASEINVSKKLRLTNAETHILNRKKYENELKRNENSSDASEELKIFGIDSVQKKPVAVKNKIDDVFIRADEKDEDVKSVKKTKKAPAINKTKKKN